MKMHFYQCLIVVILPYFATACDIDECKTGASAGLAVGCTAASTGLGVATGTACTAGAVVSFGLSCLIGIGVTAAVAGGCAAGDSAIDKASTLCGCSEDDIGLNTTLSKIDEATDEIIDNANLNKVEIIDNIDEATDEILKNLDLLRDENKEWYQTLANNQKVQVLNQITLLRRQKKANFMIASLIEKSDETLNQVIETQIISEYFQALNTLKQIGRFYKRIPKRQFGLLKKGRPLDDFKVFALNPAKLYTSIDLLFQLLSGQGSTSHGGQSVFQYAPTYCEHSYYTHYLELISEGIMLYETALVMDNSTLSIPTRKAWAKNFALVAEQYGTHCGCPPGSSLAGTGEVSKLKQNLLEPEKSYIDNFRKAVNIQNIFTREKAFRLLVVMNFDINSHALAELETFTIEDVVLVAQLLQSNKYEDLSKQYEDIKVCANYLSNDPRLKFSDLTVRCEPESTCKGQGTCNQDGTCQCNENYYGDNCEVRCIHDFTCKGQGVACTNNGLCQCNENYYGDKCEVHCDPETTCNGGGTCSNEGTTCQCKQGYIGDKCEICQSGYWKKGDECVKEGCDPNNYHILTDDTRRSSHGRGSYCDRTDAPSSTTTSPDWKGAGWYKVGNNGTITTQVVDADHCNTYASGYLASGSHHPEEEGKTNQAKICFHASSGSCYWEMQIQIKLCRGFYLYKLEELPGCTLRICTT